MATAWFFFFQADDGIRDHCVTGVQTCALPISLRTSSPAPTIRIKARDTSKTTRRLRTRSRVPPDVLEPILKTLLRRVEAERRAGASPKKKLEKRATAQAKATVLASIRD